MHIDSLGEHTPPGSLLSPWGSRLPFCEVFYEPRTFCDLIGRARTSQGRIRSTFGAIHGDAFRYPRIRSRGPGSVTTGSAPKNHQIHTSSRSLPKAHHLAKIHFRLTLISFVYGLLVLWLLLRWKLSAKYRTLAENRFSKRFLQALVFSPLIILTIDVLELPTGIYENWVSRQCGLSVQGWGSWFWDWTKGELISVILGIILIWLLYSVIRKSPRRWWFYFWLVSLPILLLVFFLQPLVIDPLFHKFDPLAQKDPALTASLERLVQRAGENIPPERMFWMNASEKTTAVDA